MKSSPKNASKWLRVPLSRWALAALFAMLPALNGPVYGNSEQALTPLSEAEADAIILAQEQAKAAQLAAQRAELDAAPIRSEARTVLENGQEVIFREVRPPAPEAEASDTDQAEVEPANPWTPAQIADLQQSSAAHQVCALSATVYQTETSEPLSAVTWEYGGSRYRAYARADFNILRTVHRLQSASGNYSFFLSVGSSEAALPISGAAIAALNPGAYQLIEGDASIAEAFAGLEALLDHYIANAAVLQIQAQRREALHAARLRYAQQHPKTPAPFILHFWGPESNEGSVQ